MFARLTGGALVLAALASCGDPLAPGSFLGTPWIRLGGTLKGNPGYDTMPVRPRMGVLWNPPGEPALDGRGQLASTVSISFPTTFELDLFDAPERPPGEIRAQGGALEAVMGFGRLVAVDDVDGNNQFTMVGGALEPPDLFIGAGPKHVVLYADKIGSVGAALNRLIANPERLTIGYQVGRGLCGQDGEPDRLELIATSASVTVELVPPTRSFPVVAGCLRLVP
jgi:hypothetical protein